MLSPSRKISDTIEQNKWTDILCDSSKICEASFIDMDEWNTLTDDDYNVRRELRSNKSDFGILLLNAIRHRITSLYRYWYESLEVNKIF